MSEIDYSRFLIAKQPKETYTKGFYWCPDCECAIKKTIEESKRLIDYCPYCGQKLRWE